MNKLHELKERFEEQLSEGIKYLGPKTSLSTACEYALLSGGKRLRPIIVMLTEEALGKTEPDEAALSVEFFHTASLIADDLPCMDNDDVRREQPSLHKLFGETVALLASYALISSAYEMIERASRGLSAEVGMEALRLATHCAGILGATGGQYEDLYEEGRDWETVKRVIEKKTVTLFEVAFVFGWLFGGGALERLADVRAMASHFGMAFQIADDLDDLIHDSEQENPMNAAIVLGVDEAYALYEEEMERFKDYLKALKLETTGFAELLQRLQALASSAQKSSVQSHS